MTETSRPPKEQHSNPLIIKQLLATPLREAPDREIVYGDRHRYTYREFEKRIARLAGGLASLGVGPGGTVAVFDYDSHRYLECFFAIPMMGAVLQTVNWRLSADQILYALNHAEAETVIIHADFLPILDAVVGRLEKVKRYVLITDHGLPETKRLFAAGYEALLESAASRYPFPDLDENSKATTFYTSGTTGNPKGVFFTHRQLMLHTFALALSSAAYDTIARFRSNDVYMPLTPMFHVHAWGFPYVATLLGAKQVYPGPFEPTRILELIRREGVTYSHCVPTVLQMLLQSPAAGQVDLSHWKVTVGGSRFPKGLARAARSRGIEVHSGYGMSESCPLVCTATPIASMADWPEERLLDVVTMTGKPVPMVEIDIVDGNDRPLPHDGHSVGEVVIRSPWLTTGYFKEPEKTKELWRNGWLHSGDVGYIDSAGYLQITDRVKDVIKSGGEWISSLDLENLLSQHEAVLESAAIGVPDQKWGERPLMVVTLKPGFRGRVGPEELKAFMKRFADDGKLPRYAVPDRFDFTEAIPKTSVGKLDKKALRASLTGRDPAND